MGATPKTVHVALGNLFDAKLEVICKQDYTIEHVCRTWRRNIGVGVTVDSSVRIDFNVVPTVLENLCLGE